MAYQLTGITDADSGLVRAGNSPEIRNIFGPTPTLLEFNVVEGLGTGPSTQIVTVPMGPFTGVDCAVVLVCSASDDGTNTTVSATWKAAAMTVGRSDNFSLQQRTVIFYSVIGDVTDEGGDLVFTVSSTSGDCSRVAVGYAYSGVNQSSPIAGTDGGNSGSTPFGDETCPTDQSCVVLSVVMNIHNATAMVLETLGDPGVVVQTQGSTDAGQGDQHSFGINTWGNLEAPADTPSQNGRWDWSGSTQAAMSMIALAPSDATGGTLMAWVNPTTFGEDGFGYIFSKDDVNSFVGGWVFHLDNNNPGGRAGLRLFHRFTGTSAAFQSASSSITLGEWQHVSVSWNKNAGNQPVFTVNGVVSTTTTLTSPTGDAGSDEPDEMWLGNVGDYSKQMDGSMAELRVYPRIVSLGEIQTIFTAYGTDSIIDYVRRFTMSPERDGIGPGTPYIDVTSTSGLLATVTLTVSSEHKEGDLLVAVVGDGANTSGTAPVISASAGGWEDQVQFPTAPAASRSAVAVFTRIAGASEPASYDFTGNQGATPKVAYLFIFRAISNRTANVAPVTGSGTSVNPVAPAITPGDPDSFVMRICAFDDATKIPTPRGDFYPAEIVGWRVQGSSGGGSNGLVLCVGGENYDDTAAPTRLFTGTSSDEYGTCSISWDVDYSTGIEGLPCKDLSVFRAHGQPQEREILGAPDPLQIGGIC